MDGEERKRRTVRKGRKGYRGKDSDERMAMKGMTSLLGARIARTARMARKRALNQQGMSIANLLTFLWLFGNSVVWQSTVNARLRHG